MKHFFVLIASYALVLPALACQSRTERARDRAGAAYWNAERTEGVKLHEQWIKKAQAVPAFSGEGAPAPTFVVTNAGSYRCFVRVQNVGIEREVYAFALDLKETLVLPRDLPGVIPLEPNGHYRLFVFREGMQPTSEPFRLSPLPIKVCRVGDEQIYCNGFAVIRDPL